MSEPCLGGVRVLDLSQYLPGPYATQILADLGAEVVKVEPPAGDPMRRLGPLDADGVSALYKTINAGKRVVRLDLKADDGRTAFARLVERADVVLESFRPGGLARLGLDPAALRARNPGLVHCALSGYGQDGPEAGRAGHDIDYMALAGGLATSGTAARPVIAHPPTADFASAVQAALATVAALFRRARSGQGAFIDVSIAGSVLAWQAVVLTGALRPGHEPRRGASLLGGGAACYQIYETADGRFVTLGALEEAFWANFCRAVGRADWSARQWEPMPQEALIGEVAALFAARPVVHWEGLLHGIDCCFQTVLEPPEVLDHPQVRARGFVHPSAGPEPLVEVLFPALFDGARPAARAPLAEVSAAAIGDAWAAG
jgi:crotonobetainyl-CoA:carnitine CoA-transferase CaiB-like acyl-CoA transferase